jgi:hypothetical protein
MSKLNDYLRSGEVFSVCVLTASLVSGCASVPLGSPAALAEEAKQKEEARVEAIKATVDELPFGGVW